MSASAADVLVNAIRTEPWAVVRAHIAARWGRAVARFTVEVEVTAAIAKVSAQLDAALEQSLRMAGDGTEAERAAVMKTFWNAFLTTQLEARPELAEVFRELPALLGDDEEQPQPSAARKTNGLGNILGGNIVQAGEIRQQNIHIR